MNIQRGDIYMAQLGEQPNGSIQAGYRPVLICSNNLNNRYSQVYNFIPLTSRRKKDLPVHVCLHNCGLHIKETTALVEQISVISKSQLGRKVGKINKLCEEQI